MKKRTELLVFAIISLFIVFVSCNKEDIDEAEDIVVAEDSDPIAYDYFVWYDTNMQNALYGSGQSAFVFIDHPGFVEETKTYDIVDTTITINRKYFNHDNCQFIVIDSFPGKKEEFYINPNNVSIENVSQKENNGWIVTFSNARCRLNGGEINNLQIIVTGNQVDVPGLCSFSVNEPTTFGPPPLATLLAESINNPPARPTQAQIDALPCDEIMGCYLVDRLAQTLTRTISNYKVEENGDIYEEETINSFTFSHSWYYRCPDGPLIRKVYCSVTTTTKRWKNGVLTNTYTTEAGYSNYYT